MKKWLLVVFCLPEYARPAARISATFSTCSSSNPPPMHLNFPFPVVDNRRRHTGHGRNDAMWYSGYDTFGAAK